jgi:hypothetical protein
METAAPPVGAVKIPIKIRSAGGDARQPGGESGVMVRMAPADGIASLPAR